uniref:Uncharacterized protein n=1 Tax=Babesia bovis TaxID=5865 RepID=S6B2A0_BABBO|nr:hypothetical protein [Babesia bovis]
MALKCDFKFVYWFIILRVRTNCFAIMRKSFMWPFLASVFKRCKRMDSSRSCLIRLRSS